MNALLFLVILITYLVRPSWLMILWLITVPLLCPILIPYTGISNSEEMLQYIWLLWGVFNRAFLLIVIYLLILKKRKLPQNIHLLFIIWSILAGYFVFHNIISHFDIAIIYQNAMGALYVCMPMLVMLLDPRTRPNINLFFGSIILIIAVQFIMIPFNMEGIIAYPLRYQESEFVRMELGLVSGTFTRSNALADFVSIAYMFIALDYFFRKRMKNCLFV